jgi:ABC-type siderophore export system fused ATPase/permease subunit
VAVAEPVPTYQESVAEGLATMGRMIDANKTACGTSTKYVLLGYSVTLILMMTPLEALLSSAPRLSNAVVAMQKIDELGLSLEGTPGCAHLPSAGAA